MGPGAAAVAARASGALNQLSANVAETKEMDTNAQYGSSTDLVHWDQHYAGNAQRRKKGKNADATVGDAEATRKLAPTRRSSQTRQCTGWAEEAHWRK